MAVDELNFSQCDAFLHGIPFSTALNRVRSPIAGVVAVGEESPAETVLVDLTVPVVVQAFRVGLVEISAELISRFPRQGNTGIGRACRRAGHQETGKRQFRCYQPVACAGTRRRTQNFAT